MFNCIRCLLIINAASFLIPRSLSARITETENDSDYRDEDRSEESLQLTHHEEDDHIKLEIKHSRDIYSDEEYAAAKKKTCKFNGEKYTAGEVILTLEENCLELTCAAEGKNIEMKQINGCTCEKYDGPTSAPTTPSPAPKCEYQETFGDTHTMALEPNKDCVINKSGVTEEEKQIILTTHNDLRTKVARGKEKQGNPGPQPKASNMRELVWNEQLAEVAQAWAEQCTKGHDLANNRRICDSSYRMVGQNVFNNFGHADQSLWEEAVQAWYDEVEFMPNTYVDSYQEPPNGMIGHYTQVVWAKTYEVGCGAIYYKAEKKGVAYPNSKKYVCNYGPSGNYKKAALYTQGKPGSNCENGKSANYKFLCK